MGVARKKPRRGHMTSWSWAPTTHLPAHHHQRRASGPPATPNSTSSGVGGGRSPGDPQAVGGGGAGAVAVAGPESDGAGAVRWVAGPCEAAGLPGTQEQWGSESRVLMGPPAAPHPPQEPPARALVSQQHLRREHQKSTERGAQRGGSGGVQAAGGPAQSAGRGPGCTARLPPLPRSRCPWC